ncbi:MAG: hypothetical protein RXO24_09420 [Acidilobus sp.]
MRGFPHSYDPEKVKGAGVALRERSPVMRTPMKGALRAARPRAESPISNDIEPCET